jgi:transcriptional regulator with XRE-family HTH domain
VFVTPRGRKRENGRVESSRTAVLRLLDEGFTQAEIARELGLTKSTVAYHVRNLGVEADQRFARRYDRQEIQRVYDSGLSVRECAELFGFNLASWFQARARGDVKARPQAMPIEELLVEDRPATSRAHLKMRLLSAGLKENVCERCGLREWLGEPIGMQLHHINGNGRDNRLENIQFLCPNCHAKTVNWGGRNVTRA